MRKKLNLLKKERFESSSVEKDEMQYNCINMVGLENGNKILFSKVLRNCTDLQLFEVEPIQIIIDYKWDTYGFNFFKYKFMIYVMFMVCNMFDGEMFSG